MDYVVEMRMMAWIQTGTMYEMSLKNIGQTRPVGGNREFAPWEAVKDVYRAHERARFLHTHAVYERRGCVVQCDQLLIQAKVFDLYVYATFSKEDFILFFHLYSKSDLVL